MIFLQHMQSLNLLNMIKFQNLNLQCISTHWLNHGVGMCHHFSKAFIFHKFKWKLMHHHHPCDQTPQNFWIETIKANVTTPILSFEHFETSLKCFLYFRLILQKTRFHVSVQVVPDVYLASKIALQCMHFAFFSPLIVTFVK